MDRPRPRNETRTLAQAEDTEDLASVISAALESSPIDISSLRRGVWTYVSAERQAGTSPGRVILALTEMIDATVRTSQMERGAVTKRVILWCVEAYFGQLGGEGASRRPPKGPEKELTMGPANGEENDAQPTSP